MKKNANVLIVDDDIEMTETLRDILEDSGYNIEVANDGFNAIEIIKDRAFDVVLMDVKMPGINGVETLKEIKRIQPEVVVAMMTAYSVEQLIDDALDEGAHGVMYKPINPIMIIEFIEQVKEEALILIVDDDLDACEVLVDMLTEKKYRVARASNGQEAIKKIKEREFNLVFLDVRMPVMNGLEIYRELQKIRSNIKVLMMTGYRQKVQDIVDEAIKIHAYACLNKPFNVVLLFKVVKGILSKKTKAEIQQIVME